MRLLHLDMIGGIAGDMTVAALVHLGASLDPLRSAMRAMGFDVEVEALPTSVSAIEAVRFSVSPASSPGVHRRLPDVLDLLDRAGLDAGARRRAESIFRKLAEAEAAVHACPIEEVDFHEVGAVDSIADAVGCALALEELAPARITCSTPLLGSGVIDSRHGPLPVPSPATLALLEGWTVRGLAIQAELTTPTGAAILASQVDEVVDSWPRMRLERVGCGAGSRSLPGRPNVLRAALGEMEAGAGRAVEEIQIETNIDDMNPELFEHLIARLLEEGAHDVWLQPVWMKKSRPGTVLGALCGRERLDALERVLLAESTSMGVRHFPVARRKLERRSLEVETGQGPVRMKVALDGGRVLTASPEYEDCRRLARQRNVPLKRIYALAMTAWESRPASERGLEDGE
ncbi:MAG: nickel pincer cofactor biosynthesis protein LarC [Deltaproteobacteria bacterium]|nr:nickel pincer cofactor biosynthesis protein LarC [Deltaproteobacteria bacterium]